MEIQLKPDVARFVEDKIRSGQYDCASDLINEAMRELMGPPEKAEFTPEHRQYLQAQVNIGLEQANRGEFVEVDVERIKADGRRWLASNQAKR